MRHVPVNSITWLFTVLIISFCGCSDYTTGSKSFGQADFSRFKTYAWLPNVDSIRVSDINHDQLFSTLSDDVDEELSARGFSTDNLEPDFLVRVSVYVNLSNALVSPQFYSYPRMLTVYNFFCSPDDYENYPEQYYYHPVPNNPLAEVTFRNGTLLVDIINAKTGEPIWLGYAESSRQFSGEVPDTNRIRMKSLELVKSIFKNFPANTNKKVTTNTIPL